MRSLGGIHVHVDVAPVSTKGLWDEVWSHRSYGEQSLRERRAGQKVASLSSFWETLRFSPTLNVCEVGCGAGHFLQAFGKVFPNAALWGCDQSSRAISRARAALAETPESNFVVSDAGYLPFLDNFFDMTFAIGVLEHIENKEFAISEIVRISKGHSYLIVFYSNARSFFSFERKFMSLFGTWKYGYQDELTIREVANLFSPEFRPIYQEVLQVDWDFPLLKTLDFICSLIFSHWGRYSCVVMEADK